MQHPQPASVCPAAESGGRHIRQAGRQAGRHPPLSRLASGARWKFMSRRGRLVAVNSATSGSGSHCQRGGSCGCGPAGQQGGRACDGGVYYRQCSQLKQSGEADRCDDEEEDAAQGASQSTPGRTCELLEGRQVQQGRPRQCSRLQQAPLLLAAAICTPKGWFAAAGHAAICRPLYPRCRWALCWLQQCHPGTMRALEHDLLQSAHHKTRAPHPPAGKPARQTGSVLRMAVLAAQGPTGQQPAAATETESRRLGQRQRERQRAAALPTSGALFQCRGL